MTNEPVEPRRIYRQVAAQIIQKMDAGIFKPGERIPAERALASLFNVSRSSIREALILLETGNRIEIRGGAGVFVVKQNTPPAVSLLQAPSVMPGPLDIFQARGLVEPAVAALAATHIQDKHIAGLNLALSNMVCCPSDDPRHIEFDRQFHLCLAEACGNSALHLAVETLWGFRTDARYRALEELPYSPPTWQNAILEHRDILVAVKNHDANAAQAAMAHHLHRAQARLSASRAASNAPCQDFLASA